MRRIIVAAFVSIDGVMQAPGGPDEDRSGGFAHGGWVAPYWSDELDAAMNRTFAGEFDLLLGRRTYDIFAAHWPYVRIDPGRSGFDELNFEIATRFNRIAKYVATHRPESLGWANSEGLGHDVAARLRALRAEGDRDLLVQGSSELVRILLAEDLVDALRLVVLPVVLGAGKRLFPDDAAAGTWRLESAQSATAGVQLLNYARAGAVASGSFAMEEPSAEELERRERIG